MEYIDIFDENNNPTGQIKEKGKAHEEVMYNIVMIGHLDFQFKPFTIKLANKNAIKYREA